MRVFDLQRFRNEKNITQKQLAEILSCKQAFVSYVEKGKRLLPDAMLHVLEENFGDITLYFNDRPDLIIEGGTPEDIKQLGTDIFSKKLIEMMNDKIIAPYGLVNDLRQEIERLNRYVGRLEAEIEKNKKHVDRKIKHYDLGEE